MKDLIIDACYEIAEKEYAMPWDELDPDIQNMVYRQAEYLVADRLALQAEYLCSDRDLVTP
ncbi:MAG: hypothetical protein TUN42_04340 [Dehalogenimonas sp.]